MIGGELSAEVYENVTNVSLNVYIEPWRHT